jgi:hypothetical protein
LLTAGITGFSVASSLPSIGHPASHCGRTWGFRGVLSADDPYKLVPEATYVLDLA